MYFLLNETNLCNKQHKAEDIVLLIACDKGLKSQAECHLNDEGQNILSLINTVVQNRAPLTCWIRVRRGFCFVLWTETNQPKMCLYSSHKMWNVLNNVDVCLCRFLSILLPLSLSHSPRLPSFSPSLCCRLAIFLPLSHGLSLSLSFTLWLARALPLFNSQNHVERCGNGCWSQISK